MSGGGLTDYSGGLYNLEEWARVMESYNPLLSKQMYDLYDLLNRYDYYLAGDIGKDAIAEAWEKYRSKWIDIDTEKVVEIMFDKCLELVNTVIVGHKNDD